jgi:hypothetical protein
MLSSHDLIEELEARQRAMIDRSLTGMACQERNE